MPYQTRRQNLRIREWSEQQQRNQCWIHLKKSSQFLRGKRTMEPKELDLLLKSLLKIQKKMYSVNHKSVLLMQSYFHRLQNHSHWDAILDELFFVAQKRILKNGNE